MANIIISNLPQVQELNDNLVTVIEDADETFKVTLGQLKFYIGQGGAITIDAEMSATSTNPVQNKVVKAAIDNVIQSLSTVATSGAYSDLTGAPTEVSSFNNDAGYLTQHQDISGKANAADLLALKERVQALESQVGNIATALDKINGE